MIYNYLISTQTKNGSVNTARLLNSIVDSSISKTIKKINTNGDEMSIYFNDDLSLSDEESLSNIISLHDGSILDEIASTTYKVELNKIDQEGKSIVASQKPVEDFDTIVSPNWCVDTEGFEIKPLEDNYINIHKAEVQFEHDLGIANITKLYIDYYVWVKDAQNGWIEVVGSQRVFDSIRSLYELGNEHYHSPAIGAEVPTGLSTISFSYPSKLKLHGTPNAEYDLSKIVCRLHEENGYPITASGSYVTIGFVTTKGSMDA